MTTRGGLAVTAISTVGAWVILLTTMGAWGTTTADTIIQFWSGVIFLISGLAIWLDTPPAPREA